MFKEFKKLYTDLPKLWYNIGVGHIIDKKLQRRENTEVSLVAVGFAI
jgi:hypothetical protein